ncbi:MAG: RluA family pseudouridine synthase [Elusimicrobiota bacterium]|jgi:23S rRNA pseudouridine1911/1915/1917 synthase|nr:RluA family pseudouridine synthase [Elusimicrobiota bacterium]
MQKDKQIFIFEGLSSRLDTFITEKIEDYPRARLQTLIKEGGVSVNGKKRKPSWPLENGDIVEVVWPETKLTINLKDLIVSETKDYFVINKPAGLLVHPQSPVWETTPKAVFSEGETLAAIILSTPPKYFEATMPRAGLVHRLDRETSGIMLVAKNQDFQEAMAALFANREVRKTYNAICSGELPDDKGTIDVPIGRLTGGKIKASPLGRQAITEYKVIERKKGFSYMELYPKTGRTNQLRVHMSWLGYPVLGDWLYKGATAPRLMLHARKLEFKHPLNGKKLTFEALPPKDFTAIWKEKTK